MNKKLLIPLGLFVGLLVLFAVGLRLNPREIPSPLIGKPVPAFTAPVLGQTVSFSPAQLQGKVWLLNIWASWCSSCREEHGVLLELARQQRVPLVCLNYKDTDTEAQQWLNAGNPYQIVPVDAQGKIGIDLGVYGTPETFLIDRAGVVRAKHVGPLTLAVVNQWLAEVQ